MMTGKIFNIFVAALFAILLTGCDSMQEQHKKTLEEKLFENFRFSEQSVRGRVDVIVGASEQKNYVLAMNQLAILSATKINDPAQKQSINLLMDQLRYSLEEQDLTAKAARSDKTNMVTNPAGQ